ncbi:arrestin domain-containing protein 3-like [Pagrus major]|uniref:arrestin domain-containing protein 3-like n=1 Tax=Pagrus major TaxID=143350 RepID=UPI003CC89A10
MVNTVLTGKAEVRWVELDGKKSKTYYAKEKYFSIKQVIIEESKGSVNNKGCHVYPFTFQIPAQDLPSSFQDTYGKIVYTLEANLSRPKRADSKAKAQFTLRHNENLNSNPSLMSGQQDITEKKLKLFSSGTVSMDANIERTGFHQGEGIKVVATIYNKSSRDIKPKYLLYMKSSYFAKGKWRLDSKKILKEVGDPIPPSADQTVTRVITIPPDTCVSILNCNILKVEYRMKVYLDVKYASDPEIRFPIVILSALQGPDGEHLPADPTYGSGTCAGSDMPGGTNYLQNPAASGPPPPTYETYGMHPPLKDSTEKL